MSCSTISIGPCEHCLAYINRTEFMSRIIDDNEDILNVLYKYSPHLGCLLTSHPMKVEAAIDCAMELGDLNIYEAYKIIHTMMMMYEEVYVRSTPTTAEELDLYQNTLSILQKDKLSFGTYATKSIYHMSQKKINEVVSAMGDNSEYYYCLIMDCIHDYEKQMEMEW